MTPGSKIGLVTDCTMGPGMVAGWYFVSLLKFGYNILYANSEDLDQMPHSGASNLSLHCLSLSH